MLLGLRASSMSHRSRARKATQCLDYSARSGAHRAHEVLARNLPRRYSRQLRHAGAAKTEIFAQMKPEHINYMLSKIPIIAR